jgi:hypothetical protein
MRVDRIVQILILVFFGLGFISVGVLNVVSVGSKERTTDAKFASIKAHEVEPETLTAIRKYVNPGRSGSAHIIFSSDRQPQVNITATRDYFNAVNLGAAVSGYYFPDGYFIPENFTPHSAANKWVFLGFAVFMSCLSFLLARAITRLKR